MLIKWAYLVFTKRLIHRWSQSGTLELQAPKSHSPVHSQSLSQMHQMLSETTGSLWFLDFFLSSIGFFPLLYRIKLANVIKKSPHFVFFVATEARQLLDKRALLSLVTEWVPLQFDIVSCFSCSCSDYVGRSLLLLDDDHQFSRISLAWRAK